jgi:hypothetical protein
MDRITIKAFSAPQEPGLCEEFIREHRQVLADFGIPEVVAQDRRWTEDPQCFVIVAMCEDQGMVGGLRLQIDHNGRPLPMQESIEPLDHRIVSELAELKPHGNGEVCGLWNANRYANKGIPVLLSAAVTAISALIDARRMVCFVAQYTRKHPARNGFVDMVTVGENGAFQYPVPKIKSLAMVNPDTILLPHVTDAQRHLLFSLRLRPKQTRIEVPAGIPLMVEYDLNVGNVTIDIRTLLGLMDTALSRAS